MDVAGKVYVLSTKASRSFDFQFPFHLYHVVVPVLIHVLDYCYLTVAIILPPSRCISLVRISRS
jgi:hypothetical protein